MPEAPPFYVWPVADPRTLVLLLLGMIAAFGAAVMVEMYRRRRDRQLRLEAEWRAVRELFHDRDVPEEDWHLVRAIVGQYAADTPYRAVTKRRLFDECMARYFAALRATAPESEVSQRGMQLRHSRMQLGLDYVPIGQRIQSTRELQTGQSVWVAHAAGHAPHWRHFTVVDVDEAFFRLALVGDEAAPEYAPGDMLKFRLWREDDARYVFDTPLHGTGAKPQRWTVFHVESLTRNQARAHYRVRHDQAVNVSILSAPLGENYDDLDQRPVVTYVRGRVTSLSGGGLAIAFQQPVPRQVLLRLTLDLPEQEARLTVYVRPVGTQHVPGGRSLLRGRFVAMNDEAREAIARFVFLKQKTAAGEEKPY